jgi:hypothetical protein
MSWTVVAAGIATVVALIPAGSSDDDSNPLLRWIADHPRDVSVVVRRGRGDASLSWNAAADRQLASTFKTIVLAAYAREVAADRVDPDERIDLAAVDRWLIDGTDGGAHAAAMAELAADGSLTLDELVRAMVEFSDNAATDELLDRLGRDRVAAALGELDLGALVFSSSPTAGALTAIAGPSLGDTIGDRITQFGMLSPGERDARSWAGAATFAENPSAAEAAVHAALAELTSWEQQVALGDVLPWRGSADALADLFERALVEQRLGPVAADVMRRHLSWPMRDRAVVSEVVGAAAKDGATAGVLAVAGVVRPRSGPNAADVVIVISLSNLDAATWTAIADGGYHHTAALELGSDPTAVTELRGLLER